jgi:hypothetical protein
MRWLFLVVLIVSSASAVWLSYCTDTTGSFMDDSLGYVYGVRFTPPSNSGQISRVSVYCYATGFVTDQAAIGIHLYHVANGVPTTRITYTYPEISWNPGWQTFDLNYTWIGGSETEFLIGVEPVHSWWGMSVHSDSFLGVDPQINPPNRNWKRPAWLTGNWEQCTTGGDFMIRTEICCVGVDASLVGMIKSAFHKD